jgi:hypothetical protein
MIGYAIFYFVGALIMCGIAIQRLVSTIYILIQKCHQQYRFREPIKYNNSSLYVKNKWWSAKRYIHNLKMMSGVSIQENHQFNV